MSNLDGVSGGLGDTKWEGVLARTHDGSNESLGEILDGCRQYLLRVANGELDVRLRTKAGASDIVQEAFLSAHANMATFRGSTRDEFLSWLRRILLNQLHTLRRQYFDSQKRQINRELSLDRDGFVSNEDQLASDDASPSRHAVMNEDVGNLRRSLSRLPTHYQQVILLRHREHLAFAHVGERLGLPTAATRQLWARAIKALQLEVASDRRSKNNCLSS